MTREEAIVELNVIHERLSNPKDCEDGCYSWEDGRYVEAIDMAIEVLDQTQWIPCSERLPEEREWIGTKQFGTTISDEVYVTIEVPSGERITKHMCFQNGSIPAYKQRSIDAFYKGGKVVAWMPLPEPYRGAEHEE